jgi:beta-lactam-binding protein with PASTA domain
MSLDTRPPLRAALLLVLVAPLGCMGAKHGQVESSVAATRLPDFVGESREKASQELARLNIEFEVAPFAPPDDDLVFDQSPRPGAPLNRVALVTLHVHCQAAPCPSPPSGKQIYDPCSCAFR